MSDAKSETPAPVNPSNADNVVFVARLSDTCTSDNLRDALVQYGMITSVTIRNRDKARGKATYAFVEFEQAEGARRALDAYANNSTLGGSMFYSIQYASPPRWTEKATARSERNRNEWDKMNRIVTRATVVLSVNTSHLDRMIDYLSVPSAANDEQIDKVEITGVISSESSNIKLVLLSAEHPTRLVRDLSERVYLAPALNRCFVVERDSMFTATTAEELAERVIGMLHEKLKTSITVKDSSLVRLRLQTCPSKLQKVIADGIDGANDVRDIVTLDPVGFSAILSVVRVRLDDVRRKEETRRAMYVMGFSAASTFVGNLNERSRKRGYEALSQNDGGSEDDASCSAAGEINRAYHKLEEAFSRYGSFPADFTSTVALDVGAAPGGWTIFLSKRQGCSKVVAVDPAELSPFVLKDEAVMHMKQKIQDALPNIEKESIGLYVSDMCLPVMERQLDIMLLAKRSGVLKSGCFFVLTLKCILGHRREAHDEQVQEVVERLVRDGPAQDIETIHLFNNRCRERTVIGRLI